MAKETISEDDYNEIVDQKNELEQKLKNSEQAIRDMASSISGAKDESWFNREIEGEKKKTAKAENRVNSLEKRLAKIEYEAELNAADSKKAEDARIEEIRSSINVSQSEHTRFRLFEKAPAGQRDIFGDSSSSVFDLGVDFNGFYGGVYVPLATVIEMGQSIGMLTAEDSESLKQYSLEMEKRAAIAPTAAKELQSGIDRLVSDFNVLIDSAVADVPVGDEDDESGESKSDKASGQADSSESD